MSDQRTIRPGVLVALHSSLVGGRTYISNTIDPTHTDEEGKQRAKWDTERIVDDPKEYAAAAAVRSKARGLIVNVCSATAFGLVCPEEKEPDLAVAFTEAQKLIDEFNATAQLTRVELRALTGRVVQDDVQAVEAITKTVGDLMEKARQAMEAKDAPAIRKVADQLRDNSAMLNDGDREKVKAVMDDVRKVARRIVKVGEEAAVEVDHETIKKVAAARTAFLNF